MALGEAPAEGVVAEEEDAAGDEELAPLGVWPGDLLAGLPGEGLVGRPDPTLEDRLGVLGVVDLVEDVGLGCAEAVEARAGGERDDHHDGDDDEAAGHASDRAGAGAGRGPCRGLAEGADRSGAISSYRRLSCIVGRHYSFCRASCRERRWRPRRKGRRSDRAVFRRAIDRTGVRRRGERGRCAGSRSASSSVWRSPSSCRRRRPPSSRRATRPSPDRASPSG